MMKIHHKGKAFVWIFGSIWKKKLKKSAKFVQNPKNLLKFVQNLRNTNSYLFLMPQLLTC